MLLRYWRDDSVAEQVIVRELGVSLEEFERTTRPVPVYTKTGTAYAKVDAAPKVSVVNGIIVAPQGVEDSVYAADGVKMPNGVRLPSGVYLVTIGGNTQKVIIR